MRASFRVATATLLMVVAGAAVATTIAPLTTEQKTDASDLIVRGQVKSVRVDVDAQAHVWTRVEVGITDTLKGVAPGATLTVESPGGIYDGIPHEVPLAARYSVEEDVLLFLAYKPARGVYGTVGMSTGKYSVRPDPSDGSPMVVQFSIPYSQAYDARFLAHPPADKRVALNDFESDITARVRAGWDGNPIPGVSAEHLREINVLAEGVR